jgi:hypothetical protein
VKLLINVPGGFCLVQIGFPPYAVSLSGTAAVLPRNGRANYQLESDFLSVLRGNGIFSKEKMSPWPICIATKSKNFHFFDNIFVSHSSTSAEAIIKPSAEEQKR